MNTRPTLLLILLMVPTMLFSGGFSKLPASARAVALGGSLVSFTNDPNVIFYNPAGIASMNSLAVSTSFTQLFPGIADDNLRYISASAVANLSFLGNVGLGVKSFSSAFWKENEIVGTYAQDAFGVLSVGGSAKLLQWSTPSPSGRLAQPEAGYSKITLSFDVGAQTTIKDIVPDNDVTIGFMMGDFTRPSIAQNGSSDASLDLKMSLGVQYFSRVYNYAVTAHYTIMGSVQRLGVGTEILAMKTSLLDEEAEVVVRVGGGGQLQSGQQGDINGGLGLSVGGLTMDYAYTIQTELQYVGGTHHISLRYFF